MSRNLKIIVSCLEIKKICELEICKNLAREFFGFRLGLGLCGGPRPRRLTKVLQPPSQCPRGADR